MLGFQVQPDTLLMKDKRFAVDFLVEELFKNLSKSLDRYQFDMIMAEEIIMLTNQMAKMAHHHPSRESHRRIRKLVYELSATITRIDGWVDVVVSALAFGDLSAYTLLQDVSWVYAALGYVRQSNNNAENTWDAATEECVLKLLKALNDATEFPAPSERALRAILKALSTEGPCLIPALNLLVRVKSWYTDNELQPIMQEHNVWSQMGVIIVKKKIMEVVWGIGQYSHIISGPYHLQFTCKQYNLRKEGRVSEPYEPYAIKLRTAKKPSNGSYGLSSMSINLEENLPNISAKV
ncbi:hypothetical protein C8J57DRAFT_1681143 [Mycena rebaudengoi]|nr:hypothetical protein C8J57DRAFT_1681143 [Mycena rebaudengoi]